MNEFYFQGYLTHGMYFCVNEFYWRHLSICLTFDSSDWQCIRNNYDDVVGLSSLFFFFFRFQFGKSLFHFRLEARVICYNSSKSFWYVLHSKVYKREQIKKNGTPIHIFFFAMVAFEGQGQEVASKCFKLWLKSDYLLIHIYLTALVFVLESPEQLLLVWLFLHQWDCPSWGFDGLFQANWNKNEKKWKWPFLRNAKWYLAFASGYSVNASHKSSLDNENKSEYPTLLTLAVLRFPVLFPGMFKILTSPKTAPSANVTNTVVPSSATTSKKRQQKSVVAHLFT